jgi:competence protein ComEA
MRLLPAKRLAPYLAAGVVVVLIGAYSLRSAGGEGEVDAVWSSGGSVSAEAPPAGGESAPGGDDVSSAVATSGIEAGGTGSPGAASDVAAQSTTSTGPPCFVQVAGAVARPGVYEVPPGSRVFQVLLLAGGMTADADQEAVPLAAQVTDGSCIRVPLVGESVEPGSVVTAPSSGPAPTGGSGARVSLSTATEAELDTLPGVGPKTAQQIIAFREEHGPFRSVEQLEDVPGIGPATVDRLRDLVAP